MRCPFRSVVALGCVLVAVSVPPAWAVPWSAPVGTAVILVPFGVSRPSGVHSGVDMRAAASAEVCSPVAGEVLFAGTVPADGGGTCVAVTIESLDGLRVTLLPLDGAYVRSGATVASGEAVGRLAAAGDDSCDETHLHMSVRQGDRYIDPAPFLPAVTSTQEPPSEADGAPAEARPSKTAPPKAAGATDGTSPAVSQEADNIIADRPVPLTSTATAAGESMGLPEARTARLEVTSGAPGAVSGAGPLASETAGTMVRQARLLPDAGTSASHAGGAQMPGHSEAGHAGARANGRTILGSTSGPAGAAAIGSFALAAAVVVLIGGASRVKALVRVR